MVISLSKDTLYLPTSSIIQEEFKQTFSSALEVLAWVSKRPAYAVAANQLGFTKRFFVAHKKFKKWGLPTDIYFNPKYVGQGEKSIHEEQCLSYPGKKFKVMRFEEIELQYFDIRDREQKIAKLSGISSIICQHEIMHLDGEDEEKIAEEVLVS